MSIKSKLAATATAATIAAAGIAIPAPARSDVTLINAFEVPAGRQDAAIAAWEKARDFLKTQPGYVSTALHETIMPNARFALVNIARWESPEAFQAAKKRMQAAKIFPYVEGLQYNAALYRAIRSDADE